MSEQLTAKDIAEQLKIDQSQVYKLIKREMRHRKFGNSIRVDRVDFESWLASKVIEPRTRLPHIKPKAPKKSVGGTGIRPSMLMRKT